MLSSTAWRLWLMACVLRYDNEAGKGDHKHIGTFETAYVFESPRRRWLIFGMMLICGGRSMNEVTIGITSRQAVSDRFLTAWETGRPQGARVGFESEEQLWKTLTLKRWQILKVMAGAGELTIREVARRVERDVKAVHGDVTALLHCGLLDKTGNGKVLFPYDALHVDFILRAA
jgi:predicted transcriptional regulator